MPLPVPLKYNNATSEFMQFLDDAQEAAGLATANQAFTMAEGVLRAFRDRLEVRDAIAFAGVLPAVLRAIFVADWDLDAPRKEFGDRAVMVADVKALRADHNFSPDHCLQAVAKALRGHVDEAAFDRVLAGLPVGAVDFWNPAPQS